jgi:hypothetical protein
LSLGVVRKMSRNILSAYPIKSPAAPNPTNATGAESPSWSPTGNAAANPTAPKATLTSNRFLIRPPYSLCSPLALHQYSTFLVSAIEGFTLGRVPSSLEDLGWDYLGTLERKVTGISRNRMDFSAEVRRDYLWLASATRRISVRAPVDGSYAARTIFGKLHRAALLHP